MTRELSTTVSPRIDLGEFDELSTAARESARHRFALGSPDQQSALVGRRIANLAWVDEAPAADPDSPDPARSLIVIRPSIVQRWRPCGRVRARSPEPCRMRWIEEEKQLKKSFFFACAKISSRRCARRARWECIRRDRRWSNPGAEQARPACRLSECMQIEGLVIGRREVDS